MAEKLDSGQHLGDQESRATRSEPYWLMALVLVGGDFCVLPNTMIRIGLGD